tara:strand:+ start:618 stop:1118 length:501 start_codon:yes stop_codon:yes gene_type:complete
MTISAAINLNINVAQSGSGTLATALSNTVVSESLSLLNGTGLNQSNQTWSSAAQLGISATDSIDMAGVISDAFGALITFTSITAVAVIADAGNGDNIEIGGNANAFASFLGGGTEIVKLPPGGSFLITAPSVTGFPVTAGTGDILDITNADGAAVANYKIVLVGRE